jgi:ubiquinone/menaquinone biosynthesis C-methylase UbiE
MLRRSMGWYDLFANVYDAALEHQYAEHRRLAADALGLAPGAFVLDVPCGTGQSFAALATGVGREGRVLGVDTSSGMLRRARARIAREGLAQTSVLQADATTLDAAAIGGRGNRAPTHLHVFLGMSVFPDPERTFATLWGVLARGGRCALIDVYAERPGLQGRMVEHLANADIRRRFWEALARVGAEFSLTELPFRWQHGGQIKLATATKA